MPLASPRRVRRAGVLIFPRLVALSLSFRELLHKSGAQSCKFGIADRPCLLQSTELFDFIRDAEANCAPNFVARLPSLLLVALRDASSLKDQVCKHENEWKHDPSYHPYCL